VNNYKKYYKDASSGFYISDIKIPTLFIHSLDDPICIKEVIPIEDIRKNENCLLILTQKGGHIEWLTGSQEPENWAFDPSLEFLLH